MLTFPRIVLLLLFLMFLELLSLLDVSTRRTSRFLACQARCALMLIPCANTEYPQGESTSTLPTKTHPHQSPRFFFRFLFCILKLFFLLESVKTPPKNNHKSQISNTWVELSNIFFAFSLHDFALWLPSCVNFTSFITLWQLCATWS